MAEDLIKAEVRMISGCRDSQTSADVSNVGEFKLPDPAGRAGGACTSAMLQVLYAEHKSPTEDMSIQEVLLKMREKLRSSGFSQIPQLSSSRKLDIQSPFTILPEGFSGKRRAMVIAINYVGQQGELRGCQNDAHNMIDYIKNVHGFRDSDITILMDDGIHTDPTYDNIMNAFRELVASCEPGDAVFTHYSGHGGKLRDDDGDEEDGYDETLVPLDYAKRGQIRDDVLYKELVLPMPEGVMMTSVMDCCHSGTVLDLPYVFVADGEEQEMHANADFNLDALAGIAGIAMAAMASGQSPAEAVINACCDIL